MELHINTGRLNIPLYRDGERTGTLSFNPKDVTFVQDYYDLLSNFEQTVAQYARRKAELQDGDAPAYFALINEVGRTICQGIDQVFGPGTCEAAFGSSVGEPEVYRQFFEGVDAAIKQERAAAMADYLEPEVNVVPIRPDGLE